MNYTRKDVEFRSETGMCRAWLYLPSQTASSFTPCIVMAHGFGGTRDAGLEPYAEIFAGAGYAVLAFDYRHFGVSDGQPRQLLSVKRQLEDWRNAIRYARMLPHVDPSKIALWGTSFSGGHVVVTAARDEEIAAISAQGPMMDGWAATINFFRYASPATSLKMGLLSMLDIGRSLMNMSPLYVPLVGSPGEVAAMSTPDAKAGYMTIFGDRTRNQVCARFALQMAGYPPHFLRRESHVSYISTGVGA